jgi:hypothetical protein
MLVILHAVWAVSPLRSAASGGISAARTRSGRFSSGGKGLKHRAAQQPAAQDSILEFFRIGGETPARPVFAMRNSSGAAAARAGERRALQQLHSRVPLHTAPRIHKHGDIARANARCTPTWA